MSKGTKLALAIVLILIFYAALCLWRANAERKQAFSHPEMTAEERRMIKRAILKHGDYPITREGERGIYIMTRGKERIRL